MDCQAKSYSVFQYLLRKLTVKPPGTVADANQLQQREEPKAIHVTVS